MQAPNELALALESRFRRLESVVEQIGLAVIATTETVESLATQVDTLAVQLQHQGHQVQQQSYQIFALSDALQTVTNSQAESGRQITQLTEALQHLTVVIQNQYQ